ncbi:MAG: hypothetical protein Kow00121_29200 [Elainellaceae cyanobacterium]
MRILVVDDDMHLARSLTDLLTRQNFIVDTCTDGQLAWEFVQTCTYDLIVLDIMLPGLDGRSLCERVRQQGVTTPVLLLTACDSSHDKVIGLDAGADDYMVKPFDWQELLARMRALLRRESAVSSTVLTWGALQLDSKTLEVSYAGEPVPLRPQEYRLLELFLRNPTYVLSCSSIIEQLWSFDDDPPLENTVRAHIKSLRRKLKSVGAPEIIGTVYGLGYRLREVESEPIAATDASSLASLVSPLAPDPSQLSEQLQELRQDLIKAWYEIQPEILEQAAVLEAAAQALSAGTITPQLHEQAIANAHKLAGTVGAYGFKQASKLARQIETLLLGGDRAAFCDWITTLQALVTALQQDLANSPPAPISTAQQVQEWAIGLDRLTQLADRMQFTQEFYQLLQQAILQDVPVSLCLLSIQNLKAINHQYGYQTGDAALRHVANLLRQTNRTQAVIGRWSGHKFAIALYNQPKPQAQQYLHKLLQDLKPYKPALILQTAIGQFPQQGGDAEALYRAVEP